MFSLGGAIMEHIHFLLVEAQKRNQDAEAQLVCKFEPLINTFRSMKALLTKIVSNN